MLHVVVATRNRHKLNELAALLNVRGIRWHSLAEYPRVGAVRETGRTFDANAIKKAMAVARATKGFALADDSGLEVDALRGAPGVKSARFAGRHGNDQANNAKLLRLLRGRPAPERGARYRCSLALANGSRLLAVTQGTWEGRIAEAPAGRKGFGYDPVFLVPRFGKTVGQLSAPLKRRMSHRAMAAAGMRIVLRRLARGATAPRRAGSGSDRRSSARAA